MSPGIVRTLTPSKSSRWATPVYLFTATLAAAGALYAVWHSGQGIPQEQARRVGFAQLSMLRQASERMINEMELKLQSLAEVPQIVSPNSTRDLRALDLALGNLHLENYKVRRYDLEGNHVFEFPEVGGSSFPDLSPADRQNLMEWSGNPNNIRAILPELPAVAGEQESGIIRYSLSLASKPQKGPAQPNGWLCLWLRSGQFFHDYLHVTRFLPESYTFVLHWELGDAEHVPMPTLLWHSSQTQWRQGQGGGDRDTLMRAVHGSEQLQEGGEDFDILEVSSPDGRRRWEVVSAVPVVFGSQRWILCQSTPYAVATESSTAQRTSMVVLGGLTLAILLVGVGLLYFQRARLELDAAEQRERQLREVQHNYRELFAENPTAMFVLAESGDLLDCNYSAERLIGLSRQEARGTALADWFEGNTLASLWLAFREQGNLATRDATLVRRRDRTGVLVEIGGRRIGDHWILMAQDVEERRELQQQIIRLKRMDSMGALASALAHDFNNLLGQIQILVSNLRSDLSPGSEAEDDLLAIEEKVEDAAEMVATLLAQRENVVSREPVVLGPVLEEYAGHLEKLVPAGVELAVDIGSELPAVWLTPHALRRVLDNLCDNAFDAMPYGGRLTLRAYPRRISPQSATDQLPAGRYAVIELADTGTGVSPEVLETLFEPFVTTKRRGKGTGLGLWTVFRFVRRVGGWIQVQSRPGKGTWFTIHLPDSPPADSKPPRSESAVGQPLPPVHAGRTENARPGS